MRTVLRDPGEPLALTVTPATLASSFWSTLAAVCLLAASRSTVATAPVTSARRCSVYAVTTTSANRATASIVTSILVRPAIGVCTARRPRRVKLNVPFVGAINEYFPLASVSVPVFVSRTFTATSARGAPVGATTVPETFTCWPTATPLSVSRKSKLIPAAPNRRGGLQPDSVFFMVILPRADGASLQNRSILPAAALRSALAYQSV